MTFTLRLVAALTVLILGCREDLSDQLDQRQFLLQSAQGFTPLQGSIIRLGFNGQQFSLNAGCNSMFADYQIGAGVLETDSIGSTLIACEPASEQQDSWLSGFFTGQPSIAMDANTLTLTSANATLVFVDREIADPDRALVGPTWSADTFIEKDFATSFALPKPPTFSFAADGQVDIDTSCNTGRGSYTVSGSDVALRDVVFTEVACRENSGVVDGLMRALFSKPSLRFEIEAGRVRLTSGDTGLSATAP